MIRIYEKTGALPANTAYCIATEYVIRGGFVPKMVWVFETDDHSQEALKQMADDYFARVIKTDLYVKEVPPDSALFNQEAERLYGTASVVCAVGTK